MEEDLGARGPQDADADVEAEQAPEPRKPNVFSNLFGEMGQLFTFSIRVGLAGLDGLRR